MTDWCGGSGQVKWLTDGGGSGQVKWLTDVVAGGKSNHWLMRWYGNTLCLALALALSLVLVLGASSDWWCGGSGKVKWLTDVVAGGKSNDWLMQWYGNTLRLALALALSLALALDWWYGGSGQVKWLTDVVAVGKSNDWLMWWQGASQIIDWCSGTIMLYV